MPAAWGPGPYTDSSGTISVYLTTVELENTGSELVNALTTDLYDNYGYEYNTNDMYTDDGGNLYLWLPVDTTTTGAETDNNSYTGSVFTTTDNAASALFTIPLKSAVTLTADTTENDVDHDIEIAFAADSGFASAISGVSYNGNTLASSQYTVDTTSNNKITLHPGTDGNAYLRTPGTADVVVTAEGYADSSVSQTILPGAAASMELTQDITAPAENGGAFARQPEITLKDKYGNICTSDSSTQVVVSKYDSGSWTLTGTVTETATSGVASFSGLGATNGAKVTHAQLAFNSNGLAQITSSSVTLVAPSYPDNNKSSDDTEIIVNGESHSAGTSKTSTNSNGKTQTTVTVDTEKLQDILENHGTGSTVTIPVTTGSEVAAGMLTGEMVSIMEDKGSTLVIQTGTATYTLPAGEINIDAVTQQFGTDVSLSDIAVTITIAEPSDETVTVVENAAEEGGYSLVVPAVDFTITCEHAGTAIEISSFTSYVERLIAIPSGVNPYEITTGVVVKQDGTTYHVPTEVVQIDGVYYAKINSLTNSTYAVVWHQIEFPDVENHWAKDSINDMGSRMILFGDENGNYNPDSDITRAKFTATIVRALGLAPESGESDFSDVSTSAWYCGYVKTALEYGIIKGYNDGTFGPDDMITREQVMMMIARTMKITGLEAALTGSEISELLKVYTDGASVSDYALDSVAACIHAGIVSGTGNNMIAPKDYASGAEVAVMVQRMLQKSELI